MGKVDNFNAHLELYNRGKSIKDMKPLKNQTYKVLMNANVDVRVIDREDCLDLLIEYDEKCKDLIYFTNDSPKASHRYFYAIPIQAPCGDNVGFVYRTLFDKNYATKTRAFKDYSKKVPFMFGFYRDFDNYDRHTKSMPIVVCEGAKDAIILKKFYPYTLANNTSSLGLNAYIIANMTDKVLLAYDNDETGHMMSKEDKETLQGLGCSVDILKYDEGFKDASDYINHPNELRAFRERFKLQLKGLIHGTIMMV